MTIDRHIFVGRDVYSRDDLKVGEIKGVTGDAEFVVVSRTLANDLLIPMDELHEIRGRRSRSRARTPEDPDAGGPPGRHPPLRPSGRGDVCWVPPP